MNLEFLVLNGTRKLNCLIASLFLNCWNDGDDWLGLNGALNADSNDGVIDTIGVSSDDFVYKTDSFIVLSM